MLLRLFFGVCLCYLTLTASAQAYADTSTTSTQQPATTVVVRPKKQVTIPVVVHVVWRTPEEQAAVQRVASQIEVLNEDFRRLNADLSEVHGAFQGIIADMEINFVLATQDPQGQPHSGIIVRQTTQENLTEITGGRRRLCYDDLGGSTAWCTACYLNIWVADLNFNTDGVAGLGIFPTDVASGAVPAEEDGVYIQTNRFGRSNTLPPPYNLGRTCTHEVGHYLNLLHLWGAATPPLNCNDCCDNSAYDDFVADTPFQVNTYQGECPGPGANSCGGGSDNVQNFMGSGADNCALMFTEGQKARAWEALQIYRSGFLAENCQSSCIVNMTEEESQAQLFQIQQNGTGIPTWSALVPNLYWELYQIDGRRIKTGHQAWAGPVQWRLNHLADGIYFLRVTNQESRQTTKLIIARN